MGCGQKWWIFDMNNTNAKNSLFFRFFYPKNSESVTCGRKTWQNGRKFVFLWIFRTNWKKITNCGRTFINSQLELLYYLLFLLLHLLFFFFLHYYHYFFFYIVVVVSVVMMDILWDIKSLDRKKKNEIFFKIISQ